MKKKLKILPRAPWRKKDKAKKSMNFILIDSRKIYEGRDSDCVCIEGNI